MSSNVGDLVRSALRDGDEHGVKYVRERHLPVERFTDLVDETYAYAWEHGGDDGAGWRLFPGGVLPWWASECDLTSEERGRLFSLRSDVVRALSARGVVERAHPRDTRLRVRRDV